MPLTSWSGATTRCRQSLLGRLPRLSAYGCPEHSERHHWGVYLPGFAHAWRTLVICLLHWLMETSELGSRNKQGIQHPGCRIREPPLQATTRRQTLVASCRPVHAACTNRKEPNKHKPSQNGRTAPAHQAHCRVVQGKCCPFFAPIATSKCRECPRSNLEAMGPCQSKKQKTTWPRLSILT